METYISPKIQNKKAFDEPINKKPTYNDDQFKKKPQNQKPFEDEIQSFPTDDFEECPEGCGRKFNAQALEKHVKVCKKVFQNKREAFDMGQKRIVSEEQVRPQNNDDEGGFIECPEGCGRKFNELALEKHVKICKKVF